MTSDEYDAMTGIERLRKAVAVFDACRESFNQRFTPAELLKLYEAHAKSEWDFYPDEWEERQIQEAIQGKVPKWDAEERPVHENG